MEKSGKNPGGNGLCNPGGTKVGILCGKKGKESWWVEGIEEILVGRGYQTWTWFYRNAELKTPDL
jgi:hypothetical protein